MFIVYQAITIILHKIVFNHSSLFYLIVLLSKLFLNKLIDLKIDWLYSVSGPKQTSFINLGRHLLFYSILWWRGFKLNICKIYLVHGSIAMWQCVAYIQNLDTTLIFDIKAKLIVFLTWLCVRVTAYLSFDIVIPCLACGCTIGQCFTCIHDLCLTLTFGLNTKLIFSPWICVWARSFLLLDIFIPNLARGCITARQRVVSVHDLDLWHQD